MPLNATFDTRRKRYKERNNQNLRLGESRCPSDVAHTCARGLCVGSGSLRTCASGHLPQRTDRYQHRLPSVRSDPEVCQENKAQYP